MRRRSLYYGDNLDILREMTAETVDLVYLDPPFNSNADYNVIFRTHADSEGPGAQIHAFEDTWHWGPEAARALNDLVTAHGELATYLDFTVRRLGHNSLSAYLVMMAPRLVELHRVLKPSGSIYLHCDPTASHYLKVLMDIVWGPTGFRNEIAWHYSGWNKKLRFHFERRHDVLLFYAKGVTQKFNSFALPWTSEEDYLRVRKQKVLEDERGRKYVLSDRGGGKRIRRYVEDAMGYGRPIDDVWNMDKVNNSARESLGYPTQKPIALLERIVLASSNPGDVVLDPFCGCGTAIAAAEKLGRSWIGIDITHLAVGLIAARLKRDFDLDAHKHVDVIGTPKDVAGARALFEQDRDGPYQFQFWINGVIGAQSFGAGATGKGKKGGDGGIDGKMYFRTPGGEKLETVIVSVKGGKQLVPGMIRDLESVVRREQAAMGVFVTLEEPTSGMRQEAAKHGFYKYGEQQFPRIQLLTVSEILDGKRPAMPAGAANVSLETRVQRSLKTDKRSKAMRGLFEETADH